MFEEQYKRNLAYLKKITPNLYQGVVSENTDDLLLSVDEKNINISYNNKFIYPNESKKFIEDSVQNFIQKPKAFSYQVSIIDTPNIYEEIHSSFIQDIDNLKEKHISSTKNKKQLEAINILLLFGIGTGVQIEEILKHIEVQHLVILDKDYKFLKASLYFINWIDILQSFSKNGKSITFIIDADVNTVSTSIINFIYKDKMMFAYYINFFHSYESDFFNDIKTKLQTNYEQMLIGWGFYDDEITSFKHTVENLKNNIQYYNIKNNAHFLKNGSVFIVANGPSLDEDIENIKNNMDKAVVFSCGSALKALENYGIVPDYHFEMERNKSTYDILIKTINKEYLKKINFIGLNLITPEVFGLFKSQKLFFRENDSGASISTKLGANIEHCNPTVANMALSFASHIGFENIYMFGMDMGFLESKKHHSQKSAYFDENKALGYSTENFNKFFTANLDKNLIVMSNTILSWCKIRAENCILETNFKVKKGINYFNCSNGAFINKTIPKNSSDIGIELRKKNKQNIIKKIEKCFKYPKEDLILFEKNMKSEKEILEKNINFIIDELKNSNIKSIQDIYQILYRTYNLYVYPNIIEKSNKSSLSFSLLKGTLVTLYARIYLYSLYTKDLQELKLFINESFKVIITFLEKVKLEIIKLNL